MKQLIQSSIAAKAAPAVHTVIADEVIRLGMGRREYRAVVVPLYERIRDAIGWVDSPAATFCPKWRTMKGLVKKELRKGPNKGIHTLKPNWRNGGTGCVWTDVETYLVERLMAYRNVLPQTYREHLKTLVLRIATVHELLPGQYMHACIMLIAHVYLFACIRTCTLTHITITGMQSAIRVPIDLQDGTKLLLVVMADGALLYRRAKIKVAMSQTEVVATVLNEGVQSAHSQIPFFMWSKGDDLNAHLQNVGYELLQKYTTSDFVVRMPAEYPGARERIAKVMFVHACILKQLHTHSTIIPTH